ncbi:hypothetical protein B0H19DRAFT_1079621 [Mycena capillaripes]|nr:hypothetical protein B0H19DRAFT_1079621 [Mycena capillaripes]
MLSVGLCSTQITKPIQDRGVQVVPGDLNVLQRATSIPQSNYFAGLFLDSGGFPGELPQFYMLQAYILNKVLSSCLPSAAASPLQFLFNPSRSRGLPNVFMVSTPFYSTLHADPTSMHSNFQSPMRVSLESVPSVAMILGQGHRSIAVRCIVTHYCRQRGVFAQDHRTLLTAQIFIMLIDHKLVLSRIGPLKPQGTEARSIEICSMRWLAYMQGFPDGDELNDTSRAMPTRWASRGLVKEIMSDGLKGKRHSIPDAHQVALGNTRIDGNSCVDPDNAERRGNQDATSGTSGTLG